MRTLFALLFVCAVAAAQPAPERHVTAHTISSDRDPKLSITLPSTVRYAGADRFILYNIADCELHAFVQPDAQKNASKLYWIQFEGYLPSRPDLHHTYDSPHHVTIGGLDFYADVWVSNLSDATAGSDLQHIESLVHGKGYTLPAEMVFVRLVHLLDAAKRKELMIIYGEDLATARLSAAELRVARGDRNQWAPWKDQVLKQASESITIAP